MKRENCDGLSCADCFLLGNQGPDWPQRAQCRRLDMLRLAMWEDEGGPSVPTEAGALAVAGAELSDH
jgi:hypothetical protein